jgi:hypothetical protein
VKIKIYVEGGGNDNPNLYIKCRQGFKDLFERAGLTGKLPRTMPCGTRRETFDNFCTAVKNAKADEFPILLVDSEGPVKNVQKPWNHLRNRPDDKWEQPPQAGDDQAHLMVQVMESWLLADPASLEQYYGDGFNANVIPKRDDIENIPKKDVLDFLERASRGSSKGEYHKGRHSFELLGRIDPAATNKCPSAVRLFGVLRRVSGLAKSGC